MFFRAWYTRARTFDGCSVEDWKALPSEGVVWVTVWRRDGTGRDFYSGGDWYHIVDGALDYVPAYPWGSHAPKPVGCLDCIKRGDGVSDAEFRRIEAEALATLSPQCEAA